MERTNVIKEADSKFKSAFNDWLKEMEKTQGKPVHARQIRDAWNELAVANKWDEEYMRLT